MSHTPIRGFCPQCGPQAYTDCEGLCVSCGATATGDGVKIVADLLALVREIRAHHSEPMTKWDERADAVLAMVRGEGT